MVLEIHMKLCVRESDFLEKKKFPQKLGKWTENGPNTGFLNLLKNFVINIYLICSVMKIYVVSCVPTQNTIIGKTLVPEIWVKLVSARQIAGFLNQPYFQKK